MRSVRARTTVFALGIVAVAAVMTTIALVVILRASLVDEVDRSIDSRAADLAGQFDSPGSVVAIGSGIDARTLAAIITSQGEVVISTDDSLDAFDLDRQIDEFDEPFDLSLVLEETEGSDNMRAVAILVFADDVEDEIAVVATSLDGVDDTVRRVAVGSAVAGLAMTLLVALLTWKLTGRALRPVAAITEEVEAITSSDLHRRVPAPPSADEIGRLATTMNRMLDRLEASHRQQQRFVSDASHELRSPLAAMAARLDVAERHRGDLSTQERIETVEGLRHDTRRMQRLIEDLLLLARSDAVASDGQRDTGRGLVDLDDVVFDAVDHAVVPDGVLLDAGAVSAGLVNGSADQLRRLVVNLVDNAARHARSRVDLTLGETPRGVVFVVDDDGAGIAAEQRDSVFERFVRLDEARGRDSGGSGLGLAIVNEIAAAHGGEISVTESPLGGARFIVTLPHAASHEHPG